MHLIHMIVPPLTPQDGADPVESAMCVMAFAKDMLRASKEVRSPGTWEWLWGHEVGM